MTPRSIRRAAERKARKAALKAARKSGIQNIVPAHQNVETEYGSVSDPNPPASIAEARLRANRANAQLSTGPRTDAGKHIASQNALKTALTGRTVLLPTDDRERYRQHLSHYFELWRPVGEHEYALVQSLADTWWRLLRIPQLEAALYAKGRTEFLDIDPHQVELETYLKYEKQFRNLALQERRLSSYATKLRAELEETQRRREETSSEDTLIENPTRELEDQMFGFEFSTAESANSLPTAHLHGPASVALETPAIEPRP